MAISDFRNFGFLTPQNKNFDFSKINAQKIQNCIDIQKMEYALSSYVFPIVVQNFKPISLFLAVKLPKNGLIVMTSFFKLNFWNF